MNRRFFLCDGKFLCAYSSVLWITLAVRRKKAVSGKSGFIVKWYTTTSTPKEVHLPRLRNAFSRIFLSVGLPIFILSSLLAGCFLRLDPDEPVIAHRGKPYSQVFKVENADTPVGGIEVVKGALPAGLKIEPQGDHRTFTISGTPTVSGTFHATLYIWCYGTNFAGSTLEEDLEFEVKD